MEKKVSFELETNTTFLKRRLLKIKAFREAKKHCEEAIEIIKSGISNEEKEAFDFMLDNGIESIKLEGKVFFRKTDRYISAKDKEAVFEFLRNEGLEYLIKPTVNSKSLTSEIKRLEEEGVEIDPEIISDNRVNRIGIR